MDKDAVFECGRQALPLLRNCIILSALHQLETVFEFFEDPGKERCTVNIMPDFRTD
jgi:hypothetical protein